MTGLDWAVQLHLVKFRSLVWLHSAESPTVTRLSKMPLILQGLSPCGL